MCVVSSILAGPLVEVVVVVVVVCKTAIEAAHGSNVVELIDVIVLEMSFAAGCELAIVAAAVVVVVLDFLD